MIIGSVDGARLVMITISGGAHVRNKGLLARLGASSPRFDDLLQVHSLRKCTTCLLALLPEAFFFLQRANNIRGHPIRKSDIFL